VFNLPSYEVLRGGKVLFHLHLRCTTVFAHLILAQTTLPVLDNPFSQHVNAVIQKTRGAVLPAPVRRAVKEDGEPPLRLWALSTLIQERADVLPSYQQFIQQLKDKVNGIGGGY
jgi:protein transport protein SEC24